MAAPNTPFKVRWGWFEESAFGTAGVVDTAAFTWLEGLPPSVDYGLTDDKSIKYRGYQSADTNDSFTSTAGGTVVISFSDVIVRQDEAAILLYSVLQNMTEGAGAGVFQKDLTIASTYAPPDFGADAGLFHTVAIYDVVASNHRLFTSCILRTLTLSADLNGDGRLRASGEFISGFTPVTTANFTDGTKWTPSAQAYFNYAAPTTKTLGGTNILMSAFDFTYNNNAERVGNDSSGDAENYAFGEMEIGGSITALYDPATDHQTTSFLAGTATAIVIDHGSTGVDPALLVTMSKCEHTGNDQDYGSVARMVTMPFKAMLDTTSNAQTVIEVSDGIDRSW